MILGQIDDALLLYKFMHTSCVAFDSKWDTQTHLLVPKCVLKSTRLSSVNTGKEQRILSEDVTYVKRIILIYLEEKQYTAAFKLIGSHKNRSQLIKHQI